jgi:predicted transposase/invertase (TIGR01784 family)
LKLSDGNAIPLELIVQVYNINHGHNPEMLKKCETLDGYSIFMGKVREYKKREKSLEKAVRNAIKYCTENNILKKFLETHGSEVYNMLLTEWNLDEAIEVAREEGWEDGREEGREEGHEEGREEGILITARNALAKGISVQIVQEITGLDLSAIDAIKAEL